MEEQKHTVAQANADLNDDGSFIDELISAREAGEFLMAPRDQITLMDVSPKQLVSVAARSEEHTSELQSLLRISYAVFCLKKNNNATSRPYRYTSDIAVFHCQSTPMNHTSYTNN